MYVCMFNDLIRNNMGMGQNVRPMGHAMGPERPESIFRDLTIQFLGCPSLTHTEISLPSFKHGYL